MEFIGDIIVAVVTALASVFITWMTKNRNDIWFEDLYSKYTLVFQVSGAAIEAIDEQLYIEMKECVEKLTLAYQSPQFTTAMFNSLVKEAKDVFDRVEILLKNRG